MKAITLLRYGGPEVLELSDLPDPRPGECEVLVRVRAASVNAADWHVMRGDPWLVRPMMGLPKPTVPIFGADVAGVVEAVGGKVEDLSVGDEVFGDVGPRGRGGFAELAVAPAHLFARKPAGTSFEEAACLGMAATTALQAARDWAPVQAGQRVLVNGASGGVGHFVVQMAKARGAHVTGVCRTRNVEMVRGLGADAVIDYTKQDFREGAGKFDVIFDAAAYRSVRETARALAPGGTLAFIGGANGLTFQAMLFGWALVRGDGKRVVVNVAKENGDDERAIAAMVAEGKLRAVIDRQFPLARTADALRYFEEKHAAGKLVVTM